MNCLETVKPNKYKSHLKQSWGPEEALPFHALPLYISYTLQQKEMYLAFSTRSVFTLLFQQEEDFLFAQQ